MKIYKYTLEDQICTVQMPEGAKVLSVHAQLESICIWALVDPSKPMTLRTFKIIGTGSNIEEPEPMTQLEFIGTVMLSNGRLVFHVFEEKMDDLVKVTILDTETGQCTQVEGYPECFWTESNGSCDCNRGAKDDDPCRAERFLIIKVDPMPVGCTIYDFNQYYSDELVERFIK